MTAGEPRRRDLPRVLRYSQERLDRMTDDEKWAWLGQAIEAEQMIGRQGVIV